MQKILIPIILIVVIIIIGIKDYILKKNNKSSINTEVNNQSSVNSNEASDEIITSAALHKELEKEVGTGISKVNAMNGTSGNYARKDKSWNSVPDFWRLFFKKNDK